MVVIITAKTISRSMGDEVFGFSGLQLEFTKLKICYSDRFKLSSFLLFRKCENGIRIATINHYHPTSQYSFDV